jgi:large subunit ribosomal protein L15
MPIYRRLPKRGFNNIFRLDYSEVNLDRLQQAVDSGKFKAGETVNGEALVKAGLLSTVKDGVRLLGRGTLTAKLTLEVAGATEAAKAAVEKAGGSVVVVASKKAGAAETAA